MGDAYQEIVVVVVVVVLFDRQIKDGIASEYFKRTSSSNNISLSLVAKYLQEDIHAV